MEVKERERKKSLSVLGDYHPGIVLRIRQEQRRPD